MSVENVVFRKIKEISARGLQPRPMVDTMNLASELLITREGLTPWLAELKQLRLVNFCDANVASVRLTLLGSVVKRDK